MRAGVRRAQRRASRELVNKQEMAMRTVNFRMGDAVVVLRGGGIC